MEKVSYTKDELRFIDNCSLALGNNKIFNNDVGHILTLDSIDNKTSEEQFKSYLFELSSEDFENVENKFRELITVSMRVKMIYRELSRICGVNPDEF